MKSVCYKNVFSKDEMAELISWQDNQPVANTETHFKISNKNLDYHIEGSTADRIIKPKLNQLIGNDHQFSTGSYKECATPYTTHVDHYNFQSHHYMFSSEKRYNCACLIPMIEDARFKTVFFDIFTESDIKMGAPFPVGWLTEKDNGLDLEDFGHFEEGTKKQLKHLPLDQAVTWELGSMLVWNRNQLHTSSNFSKYGLIKKFIVIFIA